MILHVIFVRPSISHSYEAGAEYARFQPEQVQDLPIILHAVVVSPYDQIQGGGGGKEILPVHHFRRFISL